MPIIPILLLLTGAGAGAFFGAQLDDKIDTPAQDEPALGASPAKIAAYAFVGMGLFWVAGKSGVLKLLK